MPLTVSLCRVLSACGIEYAEIMVPAVLAAIPILVVFALFQKQIVQGVAGSGIRR
jgi:multiple sugar transport system permease protein